MPLPGGPADKFGNRYELWWTVSELLRLLGGETQNVRIEDPGAEKAEFVVHGTVREFHQAKRKHSDGRWSLAELAADGTQLLQAIHNQLAGNADRFVFVSGSEAPDLAELSHRAQHAETLEEFERAFLDAEKWKKAFENLQKHWRGCDPKAAYDLLRRIEVRTIDELSLEELAESVAQALFLANPAKVCSELRTIALDSVHQTISRDDLIDRLAKRGLALRRLTKPADAAGLVNEATNRYLDAARRKFIQATLVPRPATTALLERLKADGGEAVLTGKAGVGKTACVAEAIGALQKRGMPVLAFRLDRVPPVSNTAELGQQLGLEESPVLVLAAAAAESVLLIDQLDAISTTSGRGTVVLDLVASLLNEIRGVRAPTRIHPVVVCRTFDWENDHRLRTLLPKGCIEVKVQEFGLDQVNGVLATAGFDPALFRRQQLELLRLPQNLSLFLDAGFDAKWAPAFNTAKELFDHYWDEKRRAVSARAGEDRWTAVVGLLCDEITATQQLSVPKEKLDHLPKDYVDQMSSEGVLTFDSRRYGFGHESFFDYCFARTFVTKTASITAFLSESEQHLFRRAQLRQVLAYLRDADHPRYCQELLALVAESKVRGHLKDLAFALLADVPDPSEAEWKIWEPLLDQELTALRNGQRNTDDLSALAWRHFHRSPSWFSFVDQRQLVQQWLASASDSIRDMTASYLRVHQRHSPDRVAALLEPYVDQDEKWPARLRFIIEWAELATSRRFFEMLLRLIDNGTLDDARGPIAQNSTFWSMFYELGTSRPEWVPEVIARWLRRRIVLIQRGGEPLDYGRLFGHDQFTNQPFQKAADSEPRAFVDHVLPIILEIADLAVYDTATPPKQDKVWPILIKSEHLSAEAGCLDALTDSIRALARDDSQDLHGVIGTLGSRDTYVANYLLLNLYTAGAHRFAEEAVALISDETWRLYCGFSDSPYWCAMELIRAVAPICSPENRTSLEATLLDYKSDYERTPEGYKQTGHAKYTLLSAIPPEFRSRNANARHDELERKFQKPDHTPHGIRGGFVGSPIKKEALDKMTDKQWLKAMTKYGSEHGGRAFDDFLKGGAPELAQMLKTYVEQEPERFARLSLLFSADTNPVYIEQVLSGLTKAALPSELKLAVCQKAYIEHRDEAGSAIADVLGVIRDRLPDDAVLMLQWLATEHPDPEREMWRERAGKSFYYGGDILGHGINTTRGRAADAIRDLIFHDAGYIARFHSTLDKLVLDPSTAVRSCVASTLYGVATHDLALAIDLFRRMDVSDERLLTTHYAYELLRVALYKHFDRLRPYVTRMLRSKDAKVCEAGAVLASLAAFNYESAANLVEEAFIGSARQRFGVARVASANVGTSEYRTWCEQKLAALFNDDDKDVRSEAASCFRHLEGAALESYEALIAAFCESKAFDDDTFSVLHTLENSSHRLPGITLTVCEKFLDRFGDEARDIRTARAGDVPTVAKLIFRTYHQHLNDAWTAKALDLIDRLCLVGIADAQRALEEFER